MVKYALAYLGRKIPFYKEMDFSRDQYTAKKRESFPSAMGLLLADEFLPPPHIVYFHVSLTDWDTAQPPTLPPNTAFTTYICGHAPGCRGVKGYVEISGTPAVVCDWSIRGAEGEALGI